MTERQIVNRIHKLEELKAEKEKLEAEIKAVEAEIQSYMDEEHAEEKEIGEYKVIWKLVSKMTLQGKALKADFPELHAKYCKESVSTYFKVNRRRA